MIYHIDESVIGGLTNENHKANILSALENLGISRAHGKNLVFAKNEDIYDLINNENISLVAKRAFVTAKKEMAFIASLYKEARIKVVLAFDLSLTEISKSIDDGIIYLPVQHAHSLNHFNDAIFLAENINDGRFYVEVAKSVQKHFPIFNGVKLNYEIHNGGGSTTATVYDLIKTTNRFCFCVTDSDRLRPGGSLGSTAAAIYQSDRLNPHPQCAHMIIDVYAVENLFPPLLLDRLYQDSPEVKERITKIEAINGRASWKYLPLKKGITRHFIFQGTSDSSYWKGEVIAIKGETLTCPSGAICGKENCECYEVPFIPGKSLSLVIEQNLSQPYFLDEFYEKTSMDIKKIWEQICNEVVSWFCAGHCV